MQNGSITRRIRIDASPAVVFDVISDPRHVSQWWPDEAHYDLPASDEADYDLPASDAAPGAPGRIAFATPSGEAITVGFEVVDALPHRLFSFRWTQEPGERAAPGNSFLVRFELEPDGEGTVLTMTETGFRERGWDEAAVQQAYREHEEGWDYHLARLAPYVETLRGSAP